MSKTLTINASGLPVYKKDDNYSTAHGAAEGGGYTSSFGQSYFAPGDPDYQIRRGATILDARALPADAVVSLASFNFQIEYDESDTDFDLVIQDMSPAAYPLDLTKYNRDNFSGDGGSLNTSGISGLVTIPFNATGRSWILHDARTQIGIRSSREIAQTTPTGSEYVAFSGTPYFIVTYTAVPAVTTVKSDLIEATTAYGYGKIVNIHDDDNCDKKGICYNKTGNPTVADDKVEEDGSFGNNHSFNFQLTGLDPDTKYYFKAYAHNVTGYGYGIEMEFTTEALPYAVTTEAASDIFVDNAEGNGTSYGGDATERGFEIKLAFSGCLYDGIVRHIAGFLGDLDLQVPENIWTATLIKTVTETGTFVPESFTGDLGKRPIAIFSDTLFAGETYDYRAYAIIDGTTYYGDWVEFTTATYPAGQGPDDQIPIEDIIPIELPIARIEMVPWEPPFWEIEWLEFPEFEWPAWKFPDFPYPDIPSYNGSWLGWFYYRKAYTKKDLDELRKKCRIFQDNSVEYALVINHNSRVLQQFLNTMTDYMDADEYNTFRPIIPPEHLNALARSPLDVHEFKAIINNFINNSIDNSNNVNNNFRLIRDGLSDYAYTEDEGFIDILITTRLVVDNNPDVDRLKKVIDRLNKEMANNYKVINHNLHVLRSILI